MCASTKSNSNSQSLGWHWKKESWKFEILVFFINKKNVLQND